MCQSIVVAYPQPIDCASITDPNVIANNPDYCTVVSCPAGSVLVGFSCQVVLGTPAGFYIADASGNSASTEANTASQLVCAVVSNPNADIYSYATCCVRGDYS